MDNIAPINSVQASVSNAPKTLKGAKGLHTDVKAHQNVKRINHFNGEFKISDFNAEPLVK